VKLGGESVRAELVEARGWVFNILLILSNHFSLGCESAECRPDLRVSAPLRLCGEIL